MKFVFEADEVNSNDFPELVKNAFDAFRYLLSNIDDSVELTGVNLYISAKTADGKYMSGFTDFGNTWIVKPADHKPPNYSKRISVSNRYSENFVYRDAEDKPLVKLYYSIDPKLIMNNKE